MVELADTLDLGSNAKACRFKSCYPYQKESARRTIYATGALFLLYGSGIETAEVRGALHLVKSCYPYQINRRDLTLRSWRFLLYGSGIENAEVRGALHPVKSCYPYQEKRQVSTETCRFSMISVPYGTGDISLI